MDVALGYVSAQQNDYIDRLRIQTNVGVVDLQALGLLSTGGPGSPDPAVHAQAGAERIRTSANGSRCAPRSPLRTTPAD